MSAATGRLLALVLGGVVVGMAGMPGGARAQTAAPARRVQLPPVTRVTLDNGLVVLLMPNRRVPLVDFRLVANAGAVNDPAGKEGLASLTADLLTQGAGKRDAQQIAEEIEFVGGALGASAGAEQLVVTCEVLQKDFAIGLELFSDVIVRPTFPAAEFDRKKAEASGAIAAGKDDPATVADRALPAFVMGDHPLGHPALGWEATVAGLARDDVVAYHKSRIVPERSILAVVGDIDPKAALAAIEKAFKAWPKTGERAATTYEPLARGEGRRIRIIDKPEVTQTQVRFACPAVPRNHPDYYAIVVANTILGAGFTSRLVDEIRVNQGLTYSIHSRFDMYRLTGTFVVSSFTKNETIRKMVDEVLNVVRRIQQEGPTDDEVEKAKRYLTGQFPLGLQAPDALAAQIANVEFFGLPQDYLAGFAGRIEAVTPDDVRRASKSHVCADELKILLVSNPEVARTALAGLDGTIDVQEIR
jgi:zinc protease